MLYSLFLLVLLADTQASQSHIRLKDTGTEYYPMNETVLLIDAFFQSTLHECVYRCHESFLCRIFDYDSITKRCRLFEGDTQITGEIDHSSSATSVAGEIELVSEQFVSYGHACSACITNRHLRCINATCTCPTHTYWTGIICASQKLYAASCLNNNHCRNDLNLTCLQFFQCGPISLHIGITILGDPNGILGNSTTTLNLPLGIAITGNDSILIADSVNSRVILIHQSSNASSAIFVNSQLLLPSKAMYDQTMSILYVLNYGNSRLISFNKTSSVWTTHFGSNAGPNLTQLNRPHSFTMDTQQNFYSADTWNHRVLRVRLGASSGIVVAGVTNTFGNDAFHLNFPADVVLDEINEYIYVADYGNHRVLRFKFNKTNGIVVAGGNGAGLSRNQFNGPFGIYFFHRTNTLYIADQGNYRLQRWYVGEDQGVTIAGNLNGVAGITPSTLNAPSNVVVHEDGTRLFISDRQNNRIQMFTLI